MRKYFKLSVLFALLATFYACEPQPTQQNDEPKEIGKGYYVVCEGRWGHNNASLDFYDIVEGKTTIDIFQERDSTSLGDVANDVIEKNGKLYVVVNGSNCVMVVNKQDAKKVALIPITTSENPQPRNIADAGEYLYVSCFDGNICKINPSTNQIVNTFSTQGRNPEGLAVSNSKLYVSCNGGLDYPNYDKVVEVYDISTDNMLKQIEVGLNPGTAIAKDGYVYIQIRGNYGDMPQEIIKINSQTDEITERATVSMNCFDIAGDKIIFASTDYTTYTNSYKIIPLNNLNATPQDFITNIPSDKTITTPYKISHDENNIFITDATDYVSNGRCFVFDYEGNYQIDFETYTCPQKVISKK